MTNRFFRRGVALVVATLCVAIACAGCSHAFAGRVDFQAPKGWVHSDVPTSGDVWVKPDGSNQSIMAQTTNAPLPARESGRKNISICKNHPAVLIVQRRDPGQIWEAVSTDWNARRYMAVYVRPASLAPDPAAEAAIRSICLKPK